MLVVNAGNVYEARLAQEREMQYIRWKYCSSLSWIIAPFLWCGHWVSRSSRWGGRIKVWFIFQTIVSATSCDATVLPSWAKHKLLATRYAGRVVVVIWEISVFILFQIKVVWLLFWIVALITSRDTTFLPSGAPPKSLAVRHTRVVIVWETINFILIYVNVRYFIQTIFLLTSNDATVCLAGLNRSLLQRDTQVLGFPGNSLSAPDSSPSP